MPCWGALGALRGRQTRQHHGGDGLDRVRRRRSGDDHAVSVVPPRTGHAAGLADRGQGSAEKPSQRLRVSGPGAPGRNPARRCPGARRGRSRFRRPQALPGADRGTEVRLSSSAFAATSRSPPPVARRARRPIGLAPVVAREHCAARRCRRGVSGRHRGLRAGEGHERAVVPGGQHPPTNPRGP